MRADRLLQGHVVGPRIDHGQQVALLDHLAFLELDLDELAGDLGLDVDGVERRHRSQRADRRPECRPWRRRRCRPAWPAPAAKRPCRRGLACRGSSGLRNIPAGARHDGEPQADPKQGPQPFHLSDAAPSEARLLLIRTEAAGVSPSGRTAQRHRRAATLEITRETRQRSQKHRRGRRSYRRPPSPRASADAGRSVSPLPCPARRAALPPARNLALISSMPFLA